MVRTFVAIELPQQVKAGLTGIRSELERAGADVVRWVSAEGMHLTLKFLGEIPEDMVRPAGDALGQAAEGVKPFNLEISKMGVFPDALRAKVFWIGLKGDLTSLNLLQEKVEAALGGLGFRREARAFNPHLTLARFRDSAIPERKRSFAEKAMKVKLASFGVIHVEGISLMKSALSPTGAVYAELARFRLEE